MPQSMISACMSMSSCKAMWSAPTLRDLNPSNSLFASDKLQHVAYISTRVLPMSIFKMIPSWVMALWSSFPSFESNVFEPENHILNTRFEEQWLHRSHKKKWNSAYISISLLVITRSCSKPCFQIWLWTSYPFSVARKLPHVFKTQTIRWHSEI